MFSTPSGNFLTNVSTQSPFSMIYIFIYLYFYCCVILFILDCFSSFCSMTMSTLALIKNQHSTHIKHRNTIIHTKSYVDINKHKITFHYGNNKSALLLLTRLARLNFACIFYAVCLYCMFVLSTLRLTEL